MGVDDGADVDAFIKRVADAQPVHAGFEFGIETVGNAFLDQQARSSTADLALVEPDRIDEAFDGAVDIGIVEHDVGGFTAKFERECFA